MDFSGVLVPGIIKVTGRIKKQWVFSLIWGTQGESETLLLYCLPSWKYRLCKGQQALLSEARCYLG